MDETTKQKLQALKPIFDKATGGDFSQDVPHVTTDEPIAMVYAGVQGMLEVIREKIKALESEVKVVESLDHAKTEFVSLASHQMRSPLTTINLFSEMLLKQNMNGLSVEQKRYIEEMHRASKRMVTLSNDLINLSTLEMHTFIPKMQTFSLTDFTHTLIQSLKPMIETKELQFTTHFAKDVPAVNAGSQFIKLIVMNLLTNAIHYTPEKGSITLSIDYDTDAKTFTLAVADTGYGIPEHEQEKMFQIFFRASNIREKVPEGNGLGLRIVKLILEGINGTIKFTSKEQVGTTFTVTIPQTAKLNY